MTYFNYYVQGIKNYLGFHGRASRAEFWWFNLFLFGINFAILVLGRALGTFAPGLEALAGVMLWVHGLGLALPQLAVTARRLHDTGRSGWWTLLLLVPFVGWMALLDLLVLPSEPGQNEYGLQPGGGATVEPGSGATVLSWNLFYGWMGANAGGEIAGLAVWLAVIRILDDFDARDADTAASLVLVIVTGAITVLLQWVVLRRRLARVGWWVVATVAGFLTAFLIVLLGSFLISEISESFNAGNFELLAAWLLLQTAISGAAFGLLQWLVLRREVARSGWWVAASSAGFVLGGIVTIPVGALIAVILQLVFEVDVTERLLPAVGQVVSTAVYGTITGVVLMLLLGRPRRDRGRAEVNLA